MKKIEKSDATNNRRDPFNQMQYFKEICMFPFRISLIIPEICK